MTVASRSHRGNKARGSPYPEERAAAPGPWTCCLCASPTPMDQVLPRKDPENPGSLTYKVALGAAEPLWAPFSSVALQ